MIRMIKMRNEDKKWVAMKKNTVLGIVKVFDSNVKFIRVNDKNDRIEILKSLKKIKVI